MQAIDPQLRIWHVGRRWTPWRQLFSIRTPTGTPQGRSTRPRPLATAELLLAGVVPLAWLLELVALALVLPFSLAVRVATGGAWPVLARCGGRAIWEARDGDFHASGEVAREVCDAIRRGDLPPRSHRG